jgi:hypothetical protein
LLYTPTTTSISNVISTTIASPLAAASAATLTAICRYCCRFLVYCCMPKPLPLFTLSFLVAASAAASNAASTTASTAVNACWRQHGCRQRSKKLKVTHVVTGLFSLPVITCGYTCERHKKLLTSVNGKNTRSENLVEGKYSFQFLSMYLFSAFLY